MHTLFPSAGSALSLVLGLLGLTLDLTSPTPLVAVAPGDVAGEERHRGWAHAVVQPTGGTGVPLRHGAQPAALPAEVPRRAHLSPPTSIKIEYTVDWNEDDDNIDNRSLTRSAHAAVSREAGELCLVPRVGSLQRSLDDATNTDTTCTVPISDTKSY